MTRPTNAISAAPIWLPLCAVLWFVLGAAVYLAGAWVVHHAWMLACCLPLVLLGWELYAIGQCAKAMR